MVSVKLLSLKCGDGVFCDGSQGISRQLLPAVFFCSVTGVFCVSGLPWCFFASVCRCFLRQLIGVFCVSKPACVAVSELEGGIGEGRSASPQKRLVKCYVGSCYLNVGRWNAFRGVLCWELLLVCWALGCISRSAMLGVATCTLGAGVCCCDMLPVATCMLCSGVFGEVLCWELLLVCWALECVSWSAMLGVATCMLGVGMRFVECYGGSCYFYVGRRSVLL